MALIYDKSPNLCLRIGHHQLTDKDMNPANYLPICLFYDIDGMTLILLNLVKASLHLFLGGGVAQLLTERSNTLGIPCVGQSNSSLVTIVGLAQLFTPYVPLRSLHSQSCLPPFHPLRIHAG